jgi:hypothetical protein
VNIWITPKGSNRAIKSGQAATDVKVSGLRQFASPIADIKAVAIFSVPRACSPQAMRPTVAPSARVNNCVSIAPLDDDAIAPALRVLWEVCGYPFFGRGSRRRDVSTIRKVAQRRGGYTALL